MTGQVGSGTAPSGAGTWSFPRPVVLVVVVALVSIALMAIFGQRGPSTDPGTVARGHVDAEHRERSDESDVGRWVARLPHGSFSVSVAVGRVLTVGESSSRTRGRARWVQVSWTPTDQSPGAPWPGASPKERREPSSSLVLVAGGMTYPVIDGLRSSTAAGSLAVAVTDVEGLHIRVVSEGQERRARRERGADSLGSTPGTAECGPREVAAGVLHVALTCELAARRSPYLAGLGWAPPGQDWVVVEEVSVRSRWDREGEPRIAAWWGRRESDPDVYYVGSGRPSLGVTVSGASEPTRTAGRTVLSGPDQRLEQRAYLVASEAPTTVTLRYRAPALPAPGAPKSPGAPASPIVEATTSVDLPAG